MDSVKELLERSRVIAVVGCSKNPARPSNRIALYLQRAGYKVYPVNPAFSEMLGLPCYPDVKSIPEKVDIVNVFRNASFVPEIVEDAIAAGAGAVWLQLGVGNPEAERRAADAGLEVVSEQCIMIDHGMYGIATKGE